MKEGRKVRQKRTIAIIFSSDITFKPAERRTNKETHKRQRTERIR